MDPDDGELLKLARDGNARAFTKLYGRHRDALLRFAYRLQGSMCVAEDLTQQCFLDLLRRPNGFDAGWGTTLRSYLYGTVRNLALKHTSRSDRELLTEDLSDTVSESQTPLDAVIHAETATMVREAVAKLPYLQRETLILFEFEDLPLLEIAEITQSDVGTVKARLSRGRSRLRRFPPVLRTSMRGCSRDTAGLCLRRYGNERCWRVGASPFRWS